MRIELEEAIDSRVEVVRQGAARGDSIERAGKRQPQVVEIADHDDVVDLGRLRQRVEHPLDHRPAAEVQQGLRAAAGLLVQGFPGPRGASGQDQTAHARGECSPRPGPRMPCRRVVRV